MNQPLKLIPQIALSQNEFDLFQKYIYTHFGINLTEKKKSLVINRLQKTIRSNDFKSFEEYYKFLTNSKNSDHISELIDNISTNHTFFNREAEHFSILKDNVLPDVVSRIKKSKNPYEIRMWCAAASSGEEPYTLAMVLRDYFGDAYKLWDGGVLATDISDRALNKARMGIYPKEAVEKLPLQIRGKFFKNLQNGQMQVDDVIKKDVVYRRFNLLNPFPFKKPFHIIFIRNVMIYFDETTKRNLLNKIYQYMYPGGYLFVGHAESLTSLKTPFKYVRPAIYQKSEF